MDHPELVRLAEYWLMKSLKCSFSLTEMKCCQSKEIPDSIGFRQGFSVLVECKVSRADFLADAQKEFRQQPSLGMGNFRFFLCPEGVIRPEDLPPKWGLVWIVRGKPRHIVGPRGNAWTYSGRDFFFEEKNLEAEWGLMASALRRLFQAAPPQAGAGLS